MNKRIDKKIHKREQAAHEHALSETSWGRIRLSLEAVGDALVDLWATLRVESGVWQQQARVELQKGARAVDDSLSESLSHVPVVGESAARNLHQFATDPHFTMQAPAA